MYLNYYLLNILALCTKVILTIHVQERQILMVYVNLNITPGVIQVHVKLILILYVNLKY